MTPVIVVVTSITVALLFFLAFEVWWRYAWRGDARRVQTAQLVPVDLEAFENLTDPEEEQFLRTNLSPPEFRRVQRTRLRAARLYIAALSQNAGVLAAVGQSARSNSNPEIAATGQRLVQRAIQLKIWCLLSLLRLDTAFVFPALLSPSSRIANQYLLVTYMAANLSGSVAA